MMAYSQTTETAARLTFESHARASARGEELVKSAFCSARRPVTIGQLNLFLPSNQEIAMKVMSRLSESKPKITEFWFEQFSNPSVQKARPFLLC